MNVRHLAPTPVGATVTTTATYLGNDGNFHRVEAFDLAGKIGEGEHTRAIVKVEHLLAGAQKRLMSR